jgi:hypothetical protein
MVEGTFEGAEKKREKEVKLLHVLQELALLLHLQCHCLKLELMVKR